MILSDDVIHDGRNKLLNAGQTLDDNQIKLLLERGIASVEIMNKEEQTAFEEHEKKDKETVYPTIEYALSNDQMNATVTIMPKTDDDDMITPDMVKKVLIEGGVAFGFVEPEILRIVKSFNKTRKQISATIVAKGKLAIPGKQGELEVTVPHINTMENLRQLTSAKVFCEVDGIIKKGMRVNAGTVIGKRMQDQKPVEGMDVCGEPIETSEIKPTPLNIGDNVEVENDRIFKSTVTGITCYVDDRLSVYPLDFNAKTILTLADNRMEAYVQILPPGENGGLPTVEFIEELLKKQKVVHGIITEEIQNVISEAVKGNFPEKHVIAKGTSQVDGENGKIEFLVDISGKAKPKVNEDGTVDYKNIKLVESVTEGQELARLVPPKPGKIGRNIMGVEIPFEEGVPAQLPQGTNTAPKKDDPESLVATTAGNVRYKNGVLDVSEGFSVKGDVDFTTGNITYPKSVIIKGDVKSGFEVEAGGDLEIGGTVEDAIIECGGNILVKCGFLGSGKGIIHCRGNASVAFVRNQEIRSHQNIFVAKESIGARLWAKNSIEAVGKPFSIAGGQVSARNEIKAYAIGNESGVRTEVEVGMDFTLVEEKQKTEDKIKELNSSRQKVMENLQKLKHIKQIKKELQPKEDFLLKKLITMDDKIHSQLDALEKRKEVISKKLREVGKARIMIEHAVFPGTVIKIRDRHMVVSEEIIGPKSIMFVKGYIKVI